MTERGVVLLMGTAAVQALFCIVTGSYNMFLSKLLFFYMLTLLALFGNFYLAKYSQARASKAKAQ